MSRLVLARHLLLSCDLSFARTKQAVEEQIPTVASKLLYFDEFRLEGGVRCAEWLAATGFHTGLGRGRWLVAQPSYNTLLVKLKAEGPTSCRLLVLAAGSEAWVLEWDFGRNDAILRKFLGPLAANCRPGEVQA